MCIFWVAITNILLGNLFQKFDFFLNIVTRHLYSEIQYLFSDKNTLVFWMGETNFGRVTPE